MQMEGIVDSPEDGGGDDGLFEGAGDAVEKDASSQAIAFLQEELGLSAEDPSMSFRRVPLFMGHGVQDGKVPISLGREAVSCLKHLGTSVEWQAYEGLGHWYSDLMLSHLVDTLKETTGGNIRKDIADS